MTLHCFVVHHVNTTAKELNNDLAKINRCAYQWNEFQS